MAKKQYYYALGRRKEATATVRLMRGQGNITANEKPALDYFGNKALVAVVLEPIKLVDDPEKLDLSLRLKGGGLQGQADAAKLAVARALMEMNEDLRPTLKKAGHLTRDDRAKERKKYGLKRARKAPQFTKR